MLYHIVYMKKFFLQVEKSKKVIFRKFRLIKALVQWGGK